MKSKSYLNSNKKRDFTGRFLFAVHIQKIILFIFSIYINIFVHFSKRNELFSLIVKIDCQKQRENQCYSVCLTVYRCEKCVLEKQIYPPADFDCLIDC